MADEIYYLPVTPEYITYIIERERPDGILLTFGGQTGLNVGVKLDKMGVFERYGVKVLGTPIKTLETSEDRDLFAQALKEIDIPIAESIAVETVDDALNAAKSDTLSLLDRLILFGGLGSGFAANEEELRNLAAQSFFSSSNLGRKIFERLERS